MESLFFLFLIIVFWFILNRWILPKMGIPSG